MLQSRSVWSLEPLAMQRPSGLRLTDITERSWPIKEVHHSPVHASQRPTDPSAQDVTTCSSAEKGAHPLNGGSTWDFRVIQALSSTQKAQQGMEDRAT